MNRIGYCCINISLNDGKKKKDFITVNRGMVKKTFESKGLQYVTELVLLNIDDMFKIIKWNKENDIFIYRMSSDIFPCIGFYKLENLPKFDLISKKLKAIGDYVKSVDMRMSFHPSHFCVLASLNPSVVNNTIDELNKHAEIMDMMGLEQTTFYPINIHINTTQPTKEDAAKRFCEGFTMLSDSCRKRLVVENDDKLSQYSVRMLYDMIHSVIKIPIVVDSLHYQCHSDDMSWENTLRLGISTWKDNIRPLVHHASSKKIHEDSSSKLTAHADFLYEKFESFDLDLDIELECKQKDLALFKYRKDYI